MDFFLRYLSGIAWGIIGLLVFAALDNHSLDFYLTAQDNRYAGLLFAAFLSFFVLGMAIAAVWQAETRRLQYYEQTIRFQKAYPQGRTATANFEGAEDL